MDSMPQLGAIACAFSPEDAERYFGGNWSLGPIQAQADIKKQHNLVVGLRAAFRKIGVQEVFAPHVAVASAQVVAASDLKAVRLSPDIVLYRNNTVPGDAIFLGPGHAFAMSGAGCPIIVASAGNDMIVAHAARDSLIDRGAVMGKPTRKHVSVVHAVVEALQNRGAQMDEICMYMRFAIPPDAFEHPLDHPIYGEYNRSLEAFSREQGWDDGVKKKGNSLFIGVEDLFIEQAMLLGIRRAYAFDPLTEYPSLAHTRDGKDKNRRNLIVVKRVA